MVSRIHKNEILAHLEIYVSLWQFSIWLLTFGQLLYKVWYCCTDVLTCYIHAAHFCQWTIRFPQWKKFRVITEWSISFLPWEECLLGLNSDILPVAMQLRYQLHSLATTNFLILLVNSFLSKKYIYCFVIKLNPYLIKELMFKSILAWILWYFACCYAFLLSADFLSNH